MREHVLSMAPAAPLGKPRCRLLALGPIPARRNALMLPPPQTTPGLAGGRRRRHGRECRLRRYDSCR